MAAITRSTPTFALPATQNTAPVHEFRCLYTHDLRKKAKKWHDGSARFHTFNKRVMVYDDTKNYIGDLHYRDDEEFGEGIELQLDRGVLVEVGERLGETQTDLTGIINKVHTSANAPTAVATVGSRPIQRVNVLNSQGRPKSLNELLGTSQGRAGRAGLISTSPYEQRHGPVSFNDDGPPSKRQKTAAGKENVRPITASTILPGRVTDRPLSDSVTVSSLLTRPPPGTSNVPKPPSRSHLNNRSIVDISSDDEVRPKQRAKPTRVQGANKHSVAPPPQVTSISKDLSSNTSMFRVKEISKQPISTVQEDMVQSNHSSRPSTNLAPSNASNGPALRPGMSSLKMKSQQPRWKLMYRALLPSSNKSDRTTRTASSVGGQPIVAEFIPDCAPSKVLVPSADSIHDNLIHEIDQIEAFDGNMNDQVSPPGNSSKSPQKGVERLHPVPESPLFVSQNSAQRSPSPEISMIEDDFHMLTTQETPSRPSDASKCISDSPGSFEEVPVIMPEPESPCFPPPPPARSKPPPAVSTLMLPPNPQLRIPPTSKTTTSNQRTPSPNKSRQFMRSLSANDSPLPQDPRASPSAALQSIQESPTVSTHTHSPLPEPPPPPLLAPPQPSSVYNPTRSPTKSPIQRSKSDTSAIVPTTIAAPGPSTISPEEQGPWTSLEAFLLFDKWPACKQKKKPIFDPMPTFDKDDEDGIDGLDLDVAKPVQPVFIRSARSLWRDG